MKELLVCCSLTVLLASGCVSKSKANAQARAAFQAGQRQGMMMAAAQGPSVWIVGNVKTPVVPWTQDLTLSKAIIAAEYRGAKDPDEIIVQRKGQEPLHIHPQQLLRGEDMPLQAGDQIEIRP
jgi:hypothetical protein